MNAAIARYGDQFLRVLGRGHWIGNPRVLQGGRWEKLEKNKIFQVVNDVFWIAPAWKWMLSIVPLAGVLKGIPKVEQLDLGTTASLTLTGGMFSIYSLLVQPRALLLFACNGAMCGVNAYNLKRIYDYKVQINEEKK